MSMSSKHFSTEELHRKVTPKYFIHIYIISITITTPTAHQ